MRARGPLRLKLLVLSELYLLLLIDGIVEVRGVVLDAVPLELAATAPARLLEERRVAADGEELLHLVVEELVVLAAAATCVDIVTAAVAATRTRAIDE